MTLKLKDYEHPYYFADTNYFSNEAGGVWETWGQFYDEFANNGGVDLDMNLVYRWDINPLDERKRDFCLDLLIIHQRKGIYAPHHIRLLQRKDLPEVETYLKKNWERVKENWLPLSEDSL